MTSDEFLGIEGSSSSLEQLDIRLTTQAVSSPPTELESRQQDDGGLANVDERNAVSDNEDLNVEVDDAADLHSSSFAGTVCSSLGILTCSYISRYKRRGLGSIYVAKRCTGTR